MKRFRRTFVATIVVLLLAGGILAVYTLDKDIPLVLVAWLGWSKMVEALLDLGADVNAVYDDCWTPLKAASVGRHPKVVQLLLKKGARVNVQHKCGLTPLASASLGGSARVAKLLLASGSDVNAKTKYHGGSALIIACDRGY